MKPPSDRPRVPWYVEKGAAVNLHCDMRPMKCKNEGQLTGLRLSVNDTIRVVFDEQTESGYWSFWGDRKPPEKGGLDDVGVRRQIWATWKCGKKDQDGNPQSHFTFTMEVYHRRPKLWFDSGDGKTFYEKNDKTLTHSKQSPPAFLVKVGCALSSGLMTTTSCALMRCDHN